MDGVDPALLRLAAEFIRPGDVVWDVGANLGLFSFAASVAAGPTGRVLAIEPDVWLVRLLRRSAYANRRQAPVEVFPAAVADDMGVGRFHIARRNRATSHLEGFGTTQTGGTRATELVPTITLDWLATRFPLPSVIKIDVEAAEMKVLSGGVQILRTARTIICEVAGCNAVIAANVFADHGFTLYDVQQPAAQRTPLRLAPTNTLAIRGCP